MIKITFAPTGITIGVEGDVPFETAAETVRQIKALLAGLVEVGALAFEGEIEQHRHDEQHIYHHHHTRQ